MRPFVTVEPVDGPPWRTVSAALLTLLALAAPAAAAAAACMPLPPRLVVYPESCPDGGGSCAYGAAGVVYLAPGHSAFARWHEIGHVFDAQVLSEGDRRWFSRRLGRGRPWYALPGRTSSMELFADAYASCALGLRPDRGTWVVSYGYSPGPKRHRTICAAIRRIGTRAGLL